MGAAILPRRSHPPQQSRPRTRPARRFREPWSTLGRVRSYNVLERRKEETAVWRSTPPGSTETNRRVTANVAAEGFDHRGRRSQPIRHTWECARPRATSPRPQQWRLVNIRNEEECREKTKSSLIDLARYFRTVRAHTRPSCWNVGCGTLGCRVLRAHFCVVLRVFPRDRRRRAGGALDRAAARQDRINHSY